LLVSILIFAFGVSLLVVGAEVMVSGSTRIASNMGVPPLVIGLTVVAFGTSLPETAASISAAWDNQTDLALGNIVGSNIYNLLLILGLAAIIAPLTVANQLVRQEIPLMIGACLLLIGLILDGVLSFVEALVLFGFAILYTLFLIYQARKSIQHSAPNLAPTAEGLLAKIPPVVLVVAGLIMLGFGGHWVVKSATDIALTLGVSELVVGLTVVAIGTSLPEVATCVSAVLRGQRDLAVGNVVGSNIFNIFICLGLSGMVAPNGLIAPPALLNFDIWIMLAVACITLPIVLSGRVVSRWEGWILVLYCFAYIAYTLLNANHHDALPAFSYAMLVFVIPLTVVILLSAMIIQPRGS